VLRRCSRTDLEQVQVAGVEVARNHGPVTIENGEAGRLPTQLVEVENDGLLLPIAKEIGHLERPYRHPAASAPL
jgi:hypothetical protein